MRDWLERRRSRKAVRGAFNWLLSGFPDGFAESIWRRYPGIESDLPRLLEEGNGSALAAVQIVCAVVADFIEQSNDREGNARVLDQLKRAKDETPSDPFARGILRIESTAYHWALGGKFNMNFRDIMMSEIVGALAGIPKDERAANRISGYFLKYAMSPAEKS